MDKLVKKFETIHSRDTEEVHNVKCAELTKQIAVDFNKYLQHNWINIWGGNSYVPRYSMLAKEEQHIPIEEVFMKFIENYGK